MDKFAVLNCAPLMSPAQKTKKYRIKSDLNRNSEKAAKKRVHTSKRNNVLSGFLTVFVADVPAQRPIINEADRIPIISYT